MTDRSERPPARSPGLLRRLAAEVRGTLVELVRPGESELSGRSLWRTWRPLLSAVIVLTNLIGACVVVALAMFVIPMPAAADETQVRLMNGVAAAIYVLIAVPVGTLIGARRLFRLRRWLVEDRPATGKEQRLALRAPLRLFAIQLVLWLGAAIVFAILNLAESATLALRVAITIVLAGMTTAACAYLLAERLLRPVAARALATGPPSRLAVPGVAVRAVLAWALGTGVPLAGVLAIGLVSLAGGEATATELAVAMVALAAAALTVGLLAITVAARATADPVDTVRRALGRVREGDLEVRVPVYDGTQVGQLQAGFNQMVAGLLERERIRSAFGTYVDEEIAEHVLREGAELGGEEVEVTVMFVDVRDFTGFVARTAPAEVVRRLNRLFERTVPVVHGEGGWVDKFIGDGLLAVFGTPRRLDDHADRALAAALEISRALAEDGEDGLEVGIGLDSGPVVAGNLGAPGRLEFSVIGDTVNTAARVEAATRQTGDWVLLTERTRALLRSAQAELEERPGIELRGSADPPALYAPRAAEAPSRPAAAG